MRMINLQLGLLAALLFAVRAVEQLVKVGTYGARYGVIALGYGLLAVYCAWRGVKGWREKEKAAPLSKGASLGMTALFALLAVGGANHLKVTYGWHLMWGFGNYRNFAVLGLLVVFSAIYALWWGYTWLMYDKKQREKSTDDSGGAV